MHEDSYKTFAEIYDEVIDPSMNFLFFAEKFLKKNKKKKVLDFGCGTGKYTVPLALQGCIVSGLDSSREMIKIAKKKAKKNRKKINFFSGKIESVKLKEKFDFVLSCDLINHFLSEKELSGVFSSVFSLLNKKGKFIFQFYKKNYFENRVQDEKYGGRIGENFFAWENYFDGEIFEIIFSTFESKGNNLFERKEGNVFQRAFSLNKVESRLRKAGFSSVKVFGQDFRKPKRNHEEVYFVAVK